MAGGPPSSGDLPAERVFIHATEPWEIWVETESQAVPDEGRAVAFSLTGPPGLGVERILGTVQRKMVKSARRPGEGTEGERGA